MHPTLRVPALLLLLTALGCPAAAEVPRESPGAVEKLPAPQPHWVFVSDLVLERAALVDTDSGKFLGLINGGYGAIAPLVARRRPEVYLPTTYFSRRTRGVRTDLLEIHDLTNLAPVAEVVLPGKRAIDAVAMAHSALSDDDRFVAVFNWTPQTSLSIVDVENRVLASEIEIPGCSLVYSAGPRRFFSLCADGSAMVVTLDESGRELSKQRTSPFFDPKTDPITEKGVRLGDQWLFVSFDGWVHPIDVAGAEISFPPKWSSLSETDRADNWRIGGWQHLAAHHATQRLYSLVHQGGPDTHKDPGAEVWVYSVEHRRRIQRIKLRTPGLTILGFPLEAGADAPWPLPQLLDWAIDNLVPAAVSHIAVTQDEQAQLLTASQFSGAVGVYDARSGVWTRRVQPTGWTTDLLTAPWGGTAP